MTIREKLTELLTSNGMFDNQANAVMEAVIKDEVNDSMTGRWDEDVSGYPPQLLAVLWLSVKQTALGYIDENCPKAWFRPMFVD